NRTLQTPPFSASLTGQYEIPTPIGRFDVNLSWTHTGDYYASADNGKGQIPPSSAGNDRQRVIDLLNGSLGWTAARSGVELGVWVINLPNSPSWSYPDELPFARFSSPAPPRTYGMTLTKRFD